MVYPKSPGYSPGDLLQAMSPLNVLLELPKFQIKFYKAITDSLKQVSLKKNKFNLSSYPNIPVELPDGIFRTIFAA